MPLWHGASLGYQRSFDYYFLDNPLARPPSSEAQCRKKNCQPSDPPTTAPAITLSVTLRETASAAFISVANVGAEIDIELTESDDVPLKTCFNVTTPIFVEQQSVELPQHHRSLVAVPSQDMTCVIPDGHMSMHFPPCQSVSVQ